MLACPWPIAASVICIREIWVYCVFACSLYIGLVISAWRAPPRLGAMAATVAVLGPMCFLLRAEMLGVWLLFFLVVALDTKESAEKRPMSRIIRFAVLGVVVLALYNALSSEAFQAGLFRRAAQYAGAAERAGPQGSEQGLVANVLRGGLLIRGTVGVAWVWFSPLPKIALNAGSLYAAGMVSSGFWSVACLVMLFFGRRAAAPWSSLADRERILATSVPRRFGLHILWFVVLTVSVGVTSCETRHVYAAMPLLCVLVANVLHTRYTPLGLRALQQRVLAITFSVVTAFVLATLLVFGRIDL